MTKRRRRLVALIAPATVALVVACSTSDLIEPQQCRGETCTCEQDPQQLRCRGFSPDGGSGFDDSATPDVGTIDAGDADVESDSGSADAADGG